MEASPALLRNLSAVILWTVALGIALQARILAQAITAGLRLIPLLGRYLSFVADAIENSITEPLNAVVEKSEAEISAGLHGLADSLILLVGLTLLLGVVVKDALVYLWNTALEPRILHYVAPVRTLAEKALGRVDALADTVARDLTRAERYAEAQASKALSDAQRYAEREAVAAENRATAYADDAVAKLRAVEDRAVEHAVQLADAAKAAGVAAAATALATAQADVTQLRKWAEAGIATAEDAVTAGVATAESYAATKARAAAGEAEAVAAGALAASERAATTALDGVKAIAIGAETGIEDLNKYLGTLGLAGLVASVPLLATLVQTIAVESGLENQSCRSKVKQVCQTDPAAWEQLLLGIGALGFAFSLPELASVARPLVRDLLPVIEQAA